MSISRRIIDTCTCKTHVKFLLKSRPQSSRYGVVTFVAPFTFNYHVHISGIPSALQQAGFTAGLLLLLLAAIITDYTVLLLIKDGIIANKFTYQV